MDIRGKHFGVIGGAGFIGANFVWKWIETQNSPVINLDKLTYAGNLFNLDELRNDENHIFVRGDINDRILVRNLLQKYKPRAILHFAAESHVDRSIHGPKDVYLYKFRRNFSFENNLKYFTIPLSNNSYGHY